MPAPPPWLLPALAAGIAVALPLYAGRYRGRTYAIFALVLVTFSFPGGLTLASETLRWIPDAWKGAVEWFFIFGTLTTGIHFASLVQARLRSFWFRWGFSVPGMAFLALGALAGPWLLVMLPLRALAESQGWASVANGFSLAALLPLPLVAFSLGTSLGLRREIVRIHLDDASCPEPMRVPVERLSPRTPPAEDRPLRLVQIADPHLGPWAPLHKFRSRIAELVAHDPDLVLITGDLLTMEGNETPGALAEALSPLREVPGRCFAIFGNHDHEAPDEVRSALAANGVTLLMDEEALIDTPAGKVQLVGADWVRKDRLEHLQALAAACPRRPEHLRLWLLHDPLGFGDLPDGDADLVLSGHTHGGQVGLVSFGFDWTVLTRSRWPDHGLFGNGRNRLYVHRGTGFYGFPLRVGVPGESSLIEVRQLAAAP